MNAEDLLNRKMFFGWSLKGLYQWACCIKSGLKPVYDISMGKRLWCLAHGFSPSAMAIWGEKEIKEHYRDYLSDKQYAKLHPINGSYTFWIDDKLTTKNCFYRYNAYFPSYYFQISGNMIFRLSDCKKQYEPNIDGIIACLDDVKELAIKRLVGSGGNGFYHLDKDKNGYYISGKLVNRGELRAFIEELDEYLIMEYIVNHKKLREIWPGATNTLRMLWGGVENPYYCVASLDLVTQRVRELTMQRRAELNQLLMRRMAMFYILKDKMNVAELSLLNAIQTQVHLFYKIFLTGNKFMI